MESSQDLWIRRRIRKTREINGNYYMNIKNPLQKTCGKGKCLQIRKQYLEISFNEKGNLGLGCGSIGYTSADANACCKCFRAFSNVVLY